MIDDSYYDIKVICPWCAAVHDCATPAGGEPGPPDNGSINLCITCECMSIYDTEAPGGLRVPTEDEHSEAMQLKEVRKALVALRSSHYHIKRNRKRRSN